MATEPDHNATQAPLPDRRDYFRIEDRVGLEILKVGPDTTSRHTPFTSNQLGGLHAELRRLDQDIRAQLATLAERDRMLAGLLKSLNGKLDTLARIMAFEQNPLQPDDWQTITLSEGGLAFQTTTGDYAEGETLAVRLTLPPELSQPWGIARVIDVSPGESRASTVHAAFTDIADSDRQQIARHVMRWQIRQRNKS